MCLDIYFIKKSIINEFNFYINIIYNQMILAIAISSMNFRLFILLLEKPWKKNFSRYFCRSSVITRHHGSGHYCHGSRTFGRNRLSVLA